MFAFRIRYLTETVVSADYATGNDKAVVEWPPHPDRLFSALVQAWGDLGEPEDGRRVLELLEKLPPPSIRSRRLGEGYSRTNVTRFVPANDEKRPLYRTPIPRHIPSAWVGFDPVDFVWPEADLECHRSELERLAAAVASLGHPSSLVAVECCQGDQISRP